MNNPDLKYASIILLERKYKIEEIIKLLELPKWKVYQHNKHYKKALEIIEIAKLRVTG
jgi:hypothetical protein